MDIVTTVTLAWLYFKQKVTEPTTEREPFVPPVTPIPLEENNMGIEREPFVPPVTPIPLEPIPLACPPAEQRMDLSTTSSGIVHYNPATPPCGCPPGYRKVEVKRGKHSTATMCYNGD